MSKYFSINGYWKDDQSEINNAIVKEFDDVDESNDDKIFFYGLSEEDIKEAIALGDNTRHEFVIVSYEIFK